MTESKILTAIEVIDLYTLSGYSDSRLIYRGTRDGFGPFDIDLKLFFADYYDNINSDLVVIILNNLNYVFGGFASVAPQSGTYGTDPNAYLFLLRSNGNSTSQKFPIIQSSQAHYIKGDIEETIVFGNNDIKFILGSRGPAVKTDFCSSYQCPLGMSHSGESQAYLSGAPNAEWSEAQEIEVYQMLSI